MRGDVLCGTKFSVTLFDLLFLILFFAMVIGLLVCVVRLLRGRWREAVRLLGRIGMGVAVYFGIVILVSAVSARREFKVGERQCFDDWCVAVTGVEKKPAGESMSYVVRLALSSKARRISQRERNLVVYLTDADGRRLEPVPGGAPMDVMLGPEQTVEVTRDFTVPGGARNLGVVVTHEGGFPIGWLIIDYNTWFRKAPVVWI